MLQKIKELIGSRKFWAGAIGAFLVYLNDAMGEPLNAVQMTQIIVVISGWIIGQAHVDASAVKK
jgi:hypothetical protein